MLCIAFIVCLALLPRRLREGLPIAVPVGVIVLGVVRLVLLGITVVLLQRSFLKVSRASPEDKATMLQSGIDDAMPYARFGLSLEIPLLVAAWLGDRALLKRHGAKRPPAQPAPAGASCATHGSEPATLICPRCGGFMCAECGRAELCAACAAR